MALVTRVNRSIESFADEYGEVLSQILRKNLADQNSFATGDLVDSIFHDVKASDGRAVVEITANSYLRWIDQGRDEGTLPNLTAISKWLSVKLLPQRLLWPIAMNIKNEGIDAKPVIARSVEAATQQFLPRYEAQLAELVGVVLVNDIFNRTTTKGKIVAKELL